MGKGFRPRVFVLAWLVLTSAVLSQLPPRIGVPSLPPFDPDLVLAYVTVTASKGLAPRLSQRDFRILEDDREQRIDYFALQEQPVSVGIVWGGGTGFENPAPDPDVRECPRLFIRNMVPGSEYFVMSGDAVTTPYTTDPSRIPLNFGWSGSASDHIFIGMDVLKESAHPRKILLVVAKPGGGGGGQLQNTYVERSAIRLSSTGTQIHVVSFMADADQRELNHEGSIFFSELAALTGGSYFLGPVSNVVCANLAKELRLQYLVGYHPTNNAKDGKWRKLAVKLDAPDNGSKLSVRIKRGYYAAK
jgi:Ca-activated chloride channel family protein